MIDWSLAEICPPPILEDMTDAELSIQIAGNILAISDFSCHKQGVERLITEVTRACV